MNTAVPIIMLGCEHDGATEADFSPIAWPAHNSGTTAAGGIRTKNLSSSISRLIWLVLPQRTQVGSVGRVVIATSGKQTGGGALVLPDYQIYRSAAPFIDQTNGNFTTAGSAASASNLISDVHTSGNWATLPPLMTNIDLLSDHSSDFTAWFGYYALRIRAPYSAGGGTAAMYVTGLAVQNW